MNTSFQAILATKMIKVRYMPDSQAKEEMEVFKMRFIKKCLESQFLERRIQGIKDLNEVVKDATLMHKGDETQKIIQWILENGVLNTIWEPKKTHEQIVKRSEDILSCFLKADLLTEPLLEMFWSLTKSDYKLEVFKILNNVDYYLE